MSNNTNRVNNPMKVITGPDTRWSYANVWEPKSINGGTPKYSVSLIIPKSDKKTVEAIKAAIQAAYQFTVDENLCPVVYFVDQQCCTCFYCRKSGSVQDTSPSLVELFHRFYIVAGLRFRQIVEQ